MKVKYIVEIEDKGFNQFFGILDKTEERIYRLEDRYEEINHNITQEEK